MPDWSQTMIQTYEYYIVDPGTWKDETRIGTVKTCTINRDSTVETRGSATVDIVESLGECYIRVYLVTIQNGVTEKHPLGTFLIQTPSSKFDGKMKSVSMDAYTPLMELKENSPPLGYSLLKDDTIMDNAYIIVRDNVRAPVVSCESKETLFTDFVANTDDTWLSFVSDLVANDKKYLDLDEMGRILFSPEQDTASLQPIWTYTDDNSSILYSDISIEHDLYGVPNAVEVIYSNNSDYFYAKVVNDDENSPISTISRGREILHRVTNPDLPGIPTQKQIEQYAEQLLRNLSSLEYTVTYTHGYCPTRLGDCVRLDYSRAGLRNIKARVISQSIKCESGCPVTEKAIFTMKLWR